MPLTDLVQTHRDIHVTVAGFNAIHRNVMKATTDFVSYYSSALLVLRPLCSDRCVCLSVVCRVVYCGQPVQDRHIVYIEVEWECGVDISIATIFDPWIHRYPPNKGRGRTEAG